MTAAGFWVEVVVMENGSGTQLYTATLATNTDFFSRKPFDLKFEISHP
jgi:hypothetical protein